MSAEGITVKHYFVDEAGDPVLFDGKGRVLVGTPGCSRYFAVGLLERLHKHEGYNIRFAIRGNTHRTTAFRQALEAARERFARERGLAVASALDVKAVYPSAEPALQAVDYFLWALQRTFEKSEDRFLELLWPQCSLVVDVDDTRKAEYGAYYTKQKPLTTAALKNG